METIVSLKDAGDGFGGKAAHLAALLAGGFDVPAGFAIAPDTPLDGVRTHLASLGESAVAVRSSAIDEDGATASFAGIYDSVLDVRGEDAVREAIESVRASARSARALAYRLDGKPAKMGVVVQRLVRADCAGVMFTADPVTGDRDARVVTAVSGLGEALVSGERSGEEWHVRKGRAVRRRTLEKAVLDEAQVLALIALGDRIAEHFGAPQDIEWVLEGDRFSIVQARPITALPERVEWPRPGKGPWLRNFRWGEWLSDPVSPLFATWFFPRAEVTFGERSAEVVGLRLKPPVHRIINGWYFYSPLGSGGMLSVLGALLRRPGMMLRMPRATEDPVAVAPHVAEPFRRAYEEDLAPRHRAFAAESPSDDAAAEIAYVDRACDLHGELMFNITLVGGFAWKAEAALAKFFRTHCKGVSGAPHDLVSALGPPLPCAAHHACSIDWLHPTAGELGLVGVTPSVKGDVVERREALERACLDRLTPPLRERFEAILALARRYARVRETQAHELTLAWPNVRAVLRRLGERVRTKGAIDDASDVFWLERDELEDALTGTRRCQREVAERRATWERQRKLSAPLSIGELPGFVAKMFNSLPRDLRGGDVDVAADADGSTLVGMPASAGRATGKVRLVRSPADFDRLQDGEVLLAPTTAPAWTPLFARAVAVVTDGGSLAAHASLVAREYGIPAVVATIDATQRLRDGQLVTVDGTLGRVHLLD